MMKKGNFVVRCVLLAAAGAAVLSLAALGAGETGLSAPEMGAAEQETEKMADGGMAGIPKIMILGQEDWQTEPESGEEEPPGPFRIWGEITEVGEDSLTVDNQSGFSVPGEIILRLDPEETLVLDAQTGLPAELESVEKGRFEAYPGPVMTMSLPPQTTPELVLVNLLEDQDAPLYVTAQKETAVRDGEKVFTDLDGNEYPLAEDVTAEPYLTRNIVSVEDITEGSKCLLWRDSGGKVTRIMLFAS